MLQFSRRSVLLALSAVVLAAVVRADPSWQCRVCEDTVQTWHDKFKCAGNYLDWGDVLNPDIRGCEGPMFDCNKLGGSLRASCLAMLDQFSITQQMLHRKIWESLMMNGDVYRTCTELGKCTPDPSTTELTECHRAFKEPSCGKTPLCKQYTTACTEECYVCNWLLRDFPLFQEICKPDGAALDASVPQPDDKFPAGSTGSTQNAFLETESRLSVSGSAALRTRQRLLSQIAASLRTNSSALAIAAAKHKKRVQMGRSSSGAAAALQATTGTQAAIQAGAVDVPQSVDESQEVEQETELLKNALAEAGVDPALLMENSADEAVQDNFDAARFRAGATAKKEGAKAKVIGAAQLMTGYTLPQTCFENWNDIKNIRKFRYFVSWKRYVNMMPDVLDRLTGNMWDANVVCKCLGKCELNRFEDLGLVDTCRYEEEDERMMAYLLKSEGDFLANISPFQKQPGIA